MERAWNANRTSDGLGISKRTSYHWNSDNNVLTWSNITDDLMLLLPSAKKSERLCETRQWQAQRADSIEAAKCINLDIGPACVL